jgi:hypothetical protein
MLIPAGAVRFCTVSIIVENIGNRLTMRCRIIVPEALAQNRAAALVCTREKLSAFKATDRANVLYVTFSELTRG